MSTSVSASMLLNIPADGRLVLTPEQLQQAGFGPGDHLIVTTTMPGQLYIHKAKTLPQGEDLREILQQMIRDAFQRHGYQNREQIVALIREVRQEMIGDE